MMFVFRRLALASLLLVPALLTAQGTGRLTGLVIDAAGAEPVAGARVEIVGSVLRASTTVDGRYSFPAVPAGTVAIRVVRIGYSPKSVTGIVITRDDVTEQDLTLNAQTVELGEITVTATVETGSVSSALDEQRYSTGIVNAISSEQIARSPDGDAAAALQRGSGATVQDGKYVFVRGLGDRYTTASLNGARIPSPEPEKKVVPLDLFPSSLLSGITTSKTFTPDQPGDFSGASVNIKTRDFPGKGFRALSISTGFNSASTGTDGYFGPTTSRDWLAFGGSGRAQPAAFNATDFGTNLTQDQNNALVNSLRNVWSPSARTGSPNRSMGLSIGGSTPLGSNRLGYVLSGTYSYSQEIKTDQVRALAATIGSGEGTEINRFDGTTGNTSVLWGGIANFSTTLGSHSKVSLNNTYNRTMDNEGRRELGSDENLSIPVMVMRNRYVERNIHSSQLEVHHEIAGGRLGLDWGGTVSGVQRKEPDRSEIVYSLESGTPRWLGFANEAAVRTFGNLDEHSLEGHADLTLALGDVSAGRRIRVGGLARRTERDAVNRAFAVSLNRPLPNEGDALTPEELFPTFAAEGSNYFRVAPLAAGGSYTATDNLVAGYALYAAPITRHLDLVAGARIERSTVEVRSLSTAGEPSVANPTFTDVLPSLALTWQTGENTTLRASATQTLSRPEYRELSPILYREVIGFDNVKGNADLQRALIQNYDLRFEFYPRRGELLSIALFAKQFDSPIERVYQGTSGTRIITYVNALGANNYGVELEARKRLDVLSEAFSSLTVFANATFMESKIEIDATKGSITNANRRMVGQAPYVVNAGLTWTHPSSDASATLLYNRVGERINEAGELPLPDVVVQPRDVVDFSLRMPIVNTLSAKFDARNLLDADYLTTQGNVTRESYRTGRVFSVGFSWSH
ncbi:MAG TPA: TonB-dependent receptor [Gemmatimonadales bacterium]|nr:TonB-dependent receptor [Gemmatimonadales bacterium]